MEAALLGLFMISACSFGVLLEHPASPIRKAIDNALLRRILMGLAMGTTAIALIYSPMGRRSGAHFNPAVTITFLRLRKIAAADAAFYILAQFIGGLAGTLVAAETWGKFVAHPSVHYVVTIPGVRGLVWASAAEFIIAFLMMTTVLNVSKSRLARFTGLFAGALVALYISLEAPLSGMSMNPARTFGCAVIANVWTAWWIYFVAPPLAMVSAAELSMRRQGIQAIACAKLHHDMKYRCIFCGNEGETQ